MNIGIIGLGLIGGSFGRAIVKKTPHTVYGYDLSPETMLQAELLSAIHYPLTDADYGKLDILLIAICPRAFQKTLFELAPKLKAGAIMADVGGNKRGPVEAMRKCADLYPELRYIATHPMAGREFSGIRHALPALFEKASVLMIPAAADLTSLTVMKKFLLELDFGAVLLTNELVHDRMIAYTSQLPHILSSAYVKGGCAEDHDGYSAGSFKDLTRVARMNPEMWSELMIDNKDNLLAELDALLLHLTEYRNALADGGEEALFALLEEGNQKKLAIDKNSREWKKNL